MPYSKKRSSRGYRLNPVAAAVAKQLTANERKRRYLETAANMGVDPSHLTMRRSRVYGRGGYTFGDFIRGAERTLSRTFKAAAPYTRKLADSAVMAAQARMARGSGIYTGTGVYTGSGAYHQDPVHGNNLISGYDNGSGPSVVSSPDETASVCISHKEYIADIYAPGVQGSSEVTPFAIQSWALNPGLQATFPFLSQIACNYDEYEFVQLMFYYRSTTTDIGTSTTGQCGTVIMATNYNASSALYADKQQMLEAAHAHDCKVTEHMMHGVECDPSKVTLSSEKFIRANPVIANEDKKTYDHGNFQIAVCNAPSGFNGLPIGELWVTYTVKLRKPKLFVTRGFDIDRDTFIGSTFAPVSTVMTAALWAGADMTTFLRGQQNNIGCELMVAKKGADDNNINGSGADGTAAYNPGLVVAKENASPAFVVFPASYAGNCKVTLRIKGATTVGAMVDFASGRTVASVALPFAFSSRNISPIYDIYEANESVTTPSFYDVQSLTTEYYLEIHLSVSPSTNGYDNIVQFNTLGSSTDLRGWSIDVEAYQPLMSNAQSIDKNFRPIFVNSTNQVIVPKYSTP